jgi:hypothetical protein
MLTSKAFFSEFSTRKKYGVPSHNFVKKNVLCEKGDEITRFDGTTKDGHSLSGAACAMENQSTSIK